MQDMGGPDGTSDYRAENFRQPETAVRGLRPPAAVPVPPPSAVAGAAGSSTMLAPMGPRPGEVPAIPNHGAMPISPGAVAAPPPSGQPQQQDQQTSQLYAWLARRGVESEYLTSYDRAREIIWGCHPNGPVDPAAVDRAIDKRRPTSTPAQLQNLRELGALLVEYYKPATPAAEPKPASSLAEAAAAAAQELDLQPEGAGELRIELQDVPGPPATVAGAEPVEVDTSGPALELDRPVATPVPQLLAETADALKAAPPPSASLVGDAPLVALELGGSAPVKTHGTGEMPLVMDDEKVEQPEFPDTPGWKMPPGVGSAWDPMTRDQRPSEIRKHPPPRWLIFGGPLLLIAAAAGAAFYFLGQ